MTTYARVFFAFAVVAWAAGCSEAFSGDRPILRGGGGGEDASSPVPRDAAAPTDARSGNDARPPDGNGDDRIDPITTGYAWTYSVTPLDGGASCASAGTHVVRVTSETTKDGKDAFAVQSLCDDAGTTLHAVDGDVVQIDEHGTWTLALGAPVEEGHAWSNARGTYTWHDAGAVSVPAGTFSTCWRAAGPEGAFSIYCRGIGPVRIVERSADGSGYDARLTRKNF